MEELVLMRDLPILCLTLIVALLFFPPHLMRWEVLAIFVGVPACGFVCCCVFVRLYYGEWPK
jgi:hypothetical protein